MKKANAEDLARETALAAEIAELESELASLQKHMSQQENKSNEVMRQNEKQLRMIEENIEGLESDLVLKSQVTGQMGQGIEFFERQAHHESIFREYKQKEGALLSNLIISAENLAVKLDQ